MQPDLHSSNTTSLQQALASMKRTALYVLCFSFVMNMLTLMVPIYSLQVFDRVFTTRSLDTLIGLSVLTLGAMAFFGLIYAIRSAVIAKTIEWLENHVCYDVLTRAVHAASMYPGVTAGQQLREIGTIKNFIAAGAPTIADAPWSILFVLVIYLIHPLLGSVALVSMLLFVGLAVLNEYATRKALMRASQGNIQSQLAADLLSQNAETIQAMGMMKHVLISWRSLYDASLKDQDLAQKRSATISGISRNMRLIMQIFVTGFGAFLVLEGEMTAGGMIAASILIARVLSPFDGLIGLWRQFTAARDAYNRLNRLLGDSLPAHGTTVLPAPTGTLEVETLVYSPPKKPAILRGISFQMRAGESLGIIGPSGAGKSTLAKCLIGIYPPSHGRVRLDGADVYQWIREDFGKHVGYLPQQVELFVGSIKQNIARMNPHIDDSAVIEAAQRAQVHELILQLPQGYDTPYQPGGGLLSPGQLQRVGLARALYGRPKFVVLDEPNNNLDGDGERALLGVLAALKVEGVTCVVVAHRPTILASVDNIMALRAGMIEAYDTRQNIMLRYTQTDSKPQGKITQKSKPSKEDS